ncbi:MAG: trypsin-like peptidase domain-containing protein [Gammaproteobacteria bacterium]
MNRIALIVTLFLLTGRTAFAVSCGVPAQETLNSIVHVSTASGVTASGVVVDQGKVLTAAHAVGDEQAMLVRTADGDVRLAIVIAVDVRNDLALLSTDTSGLLPVRISKHELKRRESVWAVGFPAQMGQRSTRGRFQRGREDKLHTTATIKSGNSGGGLLRCHEGRHELAGVVHGFVAKYGASGLVNTGRSVAVPIRQVVDFLDSADAQSTKVLPAAGLPGARDS